MHYKNEKDTFVRTESKFCAIKRGTRGMEQNHKRSRQAARSGIYEMVCCNLPNESNIPTIPPRDPARQASRFRQAESSASLRMTRGGCAITCQIKVTFPLKRYIKILRRSLRCGGKAALPCNSTFCRSLRSTAKSFDSTRRPYTSRVCISSPRALRSG